MITKNVNIKITDDRAVLSEKIIMYQNDKGIDIYLQLVDLIINLIKIILLVLL